MRFRLRVEDAANRRHEPHEDVGGKQGDRNRSKHHWEGSENDGSAAAVCRQRLTGMEKLMQPVDGCQRYED